MISSIMASERLRIKTNKKTYNLVITISLVTFKKTNFKKREDQKADCKESIGECEIRK